MAKQQKVEIKISKKHGPMSRLAIAKEVIDYIIDRTREGKDKSGKDFAPYSQSYRESQDFRAAGKGGKPVNLTLTRQMLNKLKLLKHENGKIVIGYDRGDPINGKVEGNRLGTYGNSKPVVKGRDFLGIERGALKEIESQFPTESAERDELIEKLAEVGITREVAKEITAIQGGRIIFDELDDIDED